MYVMKTTFSHAKGKTTGTLPKRKRFICGNVFFFIVNGSDLLEQPAVIFAANILSNHGPTVCAYFDGKFKKSLALF